MNSRLPLIALLIFSLLLPPISGTFGADGSEIAAGGQIHFQSGIAWGELHEITWVGNAVNPVVSENSGNYDVVWQDDRYGNWDIFYLRVTPWGFKLVNDSRITSYSGNDTNPSAVSRGNYTYIVWQRYLSGRWAIYFAKVEYSNRNISIVVPPKPIRTVSTDAMNPRMAMDPDGFLHLVWQERVGNNWDIMYDKIDLDGNPVFSPIDVSNDGTNSTDPVIVVGPGNEVQILWIDDNGTPGYSIMYRGLDCCGYFRTPVRRISVVSPSTEVSAVFGNALHVVFSCARENNSYEVVYTQLNDSGITMVDDTNLTTLDGINSSSPSVSYEKNRVMVAWVDAGGSIKFGMYGEDGRRLSDAFSVSDGNSSTPKVASGYNGLAIFWSEKDGNRSHLFARFGRFGDLKVQDVEAWQVGKDGRAEIAGNVSWDMPVEINADYALFINGIPAYSGTVKLNGTASLRFETVLSPGVNNITLRIDPADEIVEVNEGNNGKNTSLYVKRFQYDVVVNENCEITPGNYTNITATVINEGNWEDNYTLRIDNASDGIMAIPTTTRISLGPGEMAKVNFTITALQNAGIGKHSLNLTVISDSNITLRREITVEVRPYMNFTLEYSPFLYALPGRTYEEILYINNRGNGNDSYVVEMHHIGGWPVWVSNTSLNLSAGERGALSVTIHVPNGTAAFSRDLLFIMVRSQATGEVKNATIAVIVEPYHRATAEVISGYIDNGTFRARINVVNLGNLGDLFNFELSGELANYTALSVYSIYVGRGENATVDLWTYIPENLTAGPHGVTFTVTVSNTTLYTIPVTITVPPRYAFSASAEIVKGKIRLVVVNTGNTMDSITVVPTCKKNVTWVIEYMGKNYTNYTQVILDVNGSATLIIHLKSGDLGDLGRVTISLTSASGMKKNITVEMVSGEGRGAWSVISDNLLYIGIAIAAVVAIVIYLYVRE